MPELILGLDIGSTTARALVIDPSGRVTGRGQQRLESVYPQPGHVEQDPRDVWSRVQAVIAEALSDARCLPTDLAAVGVATQRSSVLVWDRASGEPLAPMVLWSDVRGVERAAALQALGQPAHPLAAVSKLEAVIDSVPDGRARAARGEVVWGTLDSFIVHRLSGGALHLTDASNAWSTCYLDFSTLRDWNAALIEIQQLPISFFPKLCDTYGPLGFTAKSGLGAEIPISAIVADQQSGMFAHDAWRPGDWKATCGTSATLMLATGESPMSTPGLTPMLQASHGGRTHFAVEGMVVSAGALLDWCVRDLGLCDSVASLARLAGSVESSQGVAIRPALQGLGAPHHDSARTAAIVGLTSGSTRAHVAWAAFEAIAFRLREIAECALQLEGIEAPRALPVDGGLAASDLFLGIVADLLGRPVDRHDELEATALGAGLAAAMGTGLATREALAGVAHRSRRFEPSIGEDEAESRFARWRDVLGLAQP